ncbi:MAG: BrnT family toxin [Bryobacteraceae bacterium]
MAEAAHFDWRRALIQPARIEGGEPRYRVLGTIEGIVFAAIVTPRRERMRIISLRRANEREREIYGQGK